MNIRNKTLAATELAFMPFRASASLPKTEPYAIVHQDIALVVSGTGVRANHGGKKTYTGNSFWFSGEETKALSEAGAVDAAWGNCWQKGTYSAFENHGMPTFRSYLAEGVSVEKLLQAAGLSSKEIQELGALTFQSESGYSAVLEGLHNKQYYAYDKNGAMLAQVQPMLAYRRIALPAVPNNCGLLRQTPFQYPTLMFGQTEMGHSNQCSFVKQVRKVIVGRESEQAALRLFAGERLKKSYTMADILTMGACQRIYRFGQQRIRCYGIDLADFLAQANIAADTEIAWGTLFARCGSICRQTYKAGAIERGRYLLAYYSEDAVTGRPIANQTELKLYMPHDVVSNLTALHLPAPNALQTPLQPALPLKKPCAGTAEVAASCFYIAVRNASNCHYYYFSTDELKQQYPLINSKYNYNDHTVEKSVTCNGVMLTDLIQSLADESGKALTLPKHWQIQFVEEDAYHTRTRTYIDTIEEAETLRYPILAYEIKESYAHPTLYNVDDAAYKKPENLFVYRTAGSANEAVVKNVMGIVISENGDAFQEGGYTLIAKIKQSGRELLRKTVKGAMHGMQIGVRAPEITACALAEPQAVKLLQAGEATQTEVEFLYEELPYFTVSTANAGKTEVLKQFTIGDFMQQACQIPHNLSSVKQLLKTGEAVLVTDENSHPLTGELFTAEATRNLYIDRRKIAADTSPFGYGNLILYRYNGIFLRDLQTEFAQTPKKARCKDALGNIKEIALCNAAAEHCFITYMHSQSKGTPNNTSNRKRRQKLYEAPKLVNAQNGEVVMQNIWEIEFVND